MIDFCGPYSRIPIDFPAGKPQRGTVVRCAVCGKGNVTLLSREGRRICRECYKELLKLRLMQKTKETEGVNV